MMKNIFKGILLISVLVFVFACGVTPHVTKLSNNQYHIDIQDGIPGNRSAMTAKFYETARQRCANYKIVSRQYVPNPDGTDHLIGTIECE